jgi:hypothetical protein
MVNFGGDMMAANGEIHIKDETRPCFYKGERAMFHRWSEWRQAIAESPMIGGHPAGIIASERLSK